MLSNMTCTSVIQAWLVAVALVVVAAVALGAEVNVGTAVVLLTLGLIPPLITFLLWPETESVTAGDVIRGTDRRT